MSSICTVSTAMLALSALPLLFAGESKKMNGSEQREKFNKVLSAGNYKDAYEGFRKLALDPQDDPLQVGQDLSQAIQCLRNLQRNDEIDEFREQVIQIHAQNWRLLQTAAQTLQNGDYYGYIVAGKFSRGHHRGGGKYVNSIERDRVRSLQLLQGALAKIQEESNANEKFNFYHQFAQAWLNTPWGQQSWRLQILSDLSTLPDYDEGYRNYYGQERFAPTNPDGSPIFYKIPESYEAAKSDGERWRWAMNKAIETVPERKAEIQYEFATFLRNQFDVQTLRTYNFYYGGDEDDDTKKDESGVYAVHTLKEDETIAKLASGIKRFKLSDEFNFIRILQEIGSNTKNGYAENALNMLAEIFTNRRQYDRAVEYWQQSLQKFGPGHQNYKQKQIDQILKNWGEFEPLMNTSTGQGATVDFRFRNGKLVYFKAREINVRKLLKDIKDYLKSNPTQIDWNKIEPGQIGYRLIEQGEEQYLEKEVASWSLELKPRDKHFDRRITVNTPLQKSGAYLLTAQMEDGNVSRIVIWIGDTAIVKKPLDEKTFLFVSDAVTGKPIPNANVEFFGYRQENASGLPKVLGRQYNIYTTQFAEFSDKNGQVIVNPKDIGDRHRWIIIATTPDGRLAFQGFTGIWTNKYYDHDYNATKVFAITDRPVYRPDQTVKFKFWLRTAKYDKDDNASYANTDIPLEIINPLGEKVFEKRFHTDSYGGFDGEFVLAKSAMLGNYSVRLPDHSGFTYFRVEEYKKPEFEVKIEAPSEPVMLGEKITAKIQAKYYFGAPVTKAKVKYKVSRSDQSSTWYPWGNWDWLYGRGYWWFCGDYPWYPGWNGWGCKAPSPWWWDRHRNQPEIVLENEIEIGPDGTIQIEIDTATAKIVHGDKDHRYEISAEVVDESRRTIFGTGNVLVARKPFKVFVWVDRGHYRIGEVIQASASAQTLDNKPVQGKGEFNLFKISYNDKGEPTEQSVQKLEIDTNTEGRAEAQFKASQAGQYRVSYKLTDAKGHTIEGGYLLVVTGEGFDGSQFRFNEIELINDKREYQPGEKVRLMINTNRTDSTVLLFVRPANGIYLAPKVLSFAGKSGVEEIEVSKKDMPNFFIEAITVHNGKLYSATKEIIVPPEKRVLNAELTPSSMNYKPGENAKVKIKLTDFSGEPFVGSTVITIYDKALEYISGGSNIAEIKSFFWKWRRQHRPQSEFSLNLNSFNLLRQNEIGMGNLGVFGDQDADDSELDRKQSRGYFGRGGGKAGALKSRMMKAGLPDEAAPAAAAEVEYLGMAKESKDDVSNDFEEGGENTQGESQAVQPTVRSRFADLAYWNASITTDKSGTAEIELKMPENLTGWKIKSWSMGPRTEVGEAEIEVVTSKNLLLRMQAPRFFVEKDEVVLSANVHNYLKNGKLVSVSLEIDGKCLEAMDKLQRSVKIESNGEERVDWRVKVVREGETVIRMKALTDEESDAMEMRFPVAVHGMMKTESFSGGIRPEQNSTSFTINVPAERRVGESQLEIRYSPTLAGAMVDALPYLVEYPYGCTEQTLNRFLPTVITQKVLLDMKLDLKAIQEKRTNLNAQEIGEDKERAKQWKHWNRNPVFDQDEVRRMVQQGLIALTSMQLSDGGWGWFSGYGEHSYPHTTAYVVHGLQIAAQNGVALVPGVLERGVEWLKVYQAQQIKELKNAPTKTNPWKTNASDLDAFVFMVLSDANQVESEMREFLYRDRTKLSVYAKAMFGIALQKQNESEKLAMILQNIEQYLVQDEENQTAYLKLGNESYWWYWYGSEYEAQAYYLKLLSVAEPKAEKTSRLVKYLINNRKHATYWNSTRDTAICIEAMADYLRASGEDKPDMTLEIYLDGRKQKEVQINAENLFSFDNKLVLLGDSVETGKHTIELCKKGKGPIYFNAYLSYFSLEDFISKAGLEVKVNRKYYRLKEKDKTIQVSGSHGQVVGQKVEKYEREELANLAMLKSGELVEIELEIDSKNDYEYLLFEDMKAAGFEPVEVRSGYNGNDMGAYVEFRDDRVSFFVRWLARGKHSVSYRLKAEIPGKFSALPTRAHAMYAPELKANSDEIKLNIEDKAK